MPRYFTSFLPPLTASASVFSFVDAENALCYSIIARTGFHIITIFSLWTTDALF
jgi:hypothetical protein